MASGRGSYYGFPFLRFIPHNSPYHRQAVYGALYNHFAAIDALNITPAGWHIPTKAESKTLSDYLGGNSVASGHLKETGTVFWTTEHADNSSLFNARGSGRRIYDTGLFELLKGSMYFWCSDTVLTNGGAIAGMVHSDTVLQAYDGSTTYYLDKNYGLALRPMKDSTTLSDGETGTYTGNDGKKYTTICIGTQEWLAQNLAETRYRDGSLIPEVTDASAWAALTTGALCAYNNDWSNV